MLTILNNISQQLNNISQSLVHPSYSPEIIAAIIAAAAAIITLLITKYKERSIQQRNLKEEKYISFLSALIALRAGYGTNRQLIETIQVMNLIGNSSVVKATSDFIELILEKKAESGNKSENTSNNPNKDLNKEEIQNERYIALIKAMREDLYGKNANKNFPNTLPFVITSKSTKEQVEEMLEIQQLVKTQQLQK